MAISPVGDIVMDVVKAADPAEVQAAREKLAAGRPAASGATFSINDTANDTAGAGEAAGSQPEVKAQQKPFQRFEAMVLQNFVESMLPKSDDAYGGGMAGEMWKGLMAEKLAGVMSERGGIGIANRLLADHYKTQDGKSASIGPVSEAPSQAGAGETMLSSALMNEMQRRAMGSLWNAAPADES